MTPHHVKEAHKAFFQLTSSQGGWLCAAFAITFNISFNSHPHKEDDGRHEPVHTWWLLSTHILTRRMTLALRIHSLSYSLSTHILTRRMTTSNATIYCIVGTFNSHPHKEDDQKGRWQQGGIYLSTHILTRRMTLDGHIVSLKIESFNSHPHKEDDWICSSVKPCSFLSTHILTRRMTRIGHAFRVQ